MPQTAGFILERLRAWGVHRIFGYPGDVINSLLGALNRADDDPGLEVVVDPEIPPIPPHIKKRRAKKTAKALREGGPQAWGIAIKGAKQKMYEFTESLRDKVPGAGQ